MLHAQAYSERCPECSRPLLERVASLRAAEARSYGAPVVGLKDFLLLHKEVEEAQKELETRLDLKMFSWVRAGIGPDGKFVMNYYCRCERCDFGFEREVNG